MWTKLDQFAIFLANQSVSTQGPDVGTSKRSLHNMAMLVIGLTDRLTGKSEVLLLSLFVDTNHHLMYTRCV